jgi:hypothetical protein
MTYSTSFLKVCEKFRVLFFWPVAADTLALHYAAVCLINRLSFSPDLQVLVMLFLALFLSPQASFAA